MAALLAPYLGSAVLSDAQLAQLSSYLDLLLRWNARINLTAVRSPEQIVTRHFGESLFTARMLSSDGQVAAGDRLVDLGSGAGFPGLPIQLWAPALRVTLVESQYRKATFLREVVRALRLDGVEVFAGRAEDYPPSVAGVDSPTPSPQSPTTSAFLTLRAVERFDRILPLAAGLLLRLPAERRTLVLLIGASQARTARNLLPSFTFADPIAIPKSESRVLALATI
jgi:16S rRNA (guanine527-N7)-methyltransferase